MRCVYKITNKLNNKFYIGSTTQFKKRYFRWRDFTSNTDSKIKQAMFEYGRDNFVIEPIEIFSDYVDRKEILARELEYIHKLNPYYNTIGKPRSAETKRKLSDSLTGKKQDKESVKKRSDSLKERFAIQPRNSESWLKDVLVVEENKIIHGVKNAASYFMVHPSTITKAIKRQGTVKGVHVKLLECRD